MEIDFSEEQQVPSALITGIAFGVLTEAQTVCVFSWILVFLNIAVPSQQYSLRWCFSFDHHSNINILYSYLCVLTTQ
jgi:hypothetical protein